MSLEYCYECGEPTGHAGELEDSLFLWGDPYCDQCHHDILSDLPDKFERLQSEHRSLQTQLEAANAEIERLRVKYGGAVDRFCDENAKVNALEKREAAYQAFVEAFDGSFDFWVDGKGCSILGGSDIDAIEQAREQLRRVIDERT